MINHKILTVFLISALMSLPVFAQPLQGQLAAEIALPTVSGDTLRLSSFKGKVVLLDFWASWCGPCRTANRGLTKIYEKFKSKGFEIFSVSLDSEKEDWVRAIKKDKIKWKQVLDPGGWETPTAMRWQVFQLPTSYLLDREGRLIAMDLEGKDLEKALKDMLDK